MKKNAVRQRYHQATPAHLALSGSVGLLLSYALLSRALTTGSYWQYLGSLVFLVLGIKLLKRSFKTHHGKD